MRYPKIHHPLERIRCDACRADVVATATKEANGIDGTSIVCRPCARWLASERLAEIRRRPIVGRSIGDRSA